MLLKRHFERLLLSPSDLTPLRDDFEVVGVFNPGAINVEGGYRYIVIFSQFTPSTNTSSDKVLTHVSAVYGALAIRF